MAAQKQVANAPMSSSYENQWLAPEEKQRGTSPVSSRDSNDTKQSKASSESSSPQIAQQNQNQQQQQQQQQQPARKSQKDMTKAERRALQEQQRLAKQGRVAAGLPKSAKKAAELESTNKKAQQPQQQEKQTQQSAADDKQKKKARAPKTDQNEVPWLMHLDSPKKPETSTNKDLHPAVLALGLYFSEHKIVGSNARCVAMLETFSKVKFGSFITLYLLGWRIEK